MSLKAMINNKESWDQFCDYLDQEIAKYNRSLETLTDTVEIYRAQGSVNALRKLKYMRDILNG
jgi:hypothetical protein